MRASTSLAPVLLLAPALLMTMCGCAQPSDTTASAADGDSSGIRGITTVDSGSPIVYTTPRPQRPLSARLLISQHGTTTDAVTVESDKEGHFRIPLPPGTYTIRPQNLTGAPVPTARPVTVTVHPSTWTSVTIQFDSGIR